MSAGPTATGPELSGPVRRVTLRIVIAEPIGDRPLMAAAGTLDTEVAASARAVLVDNGYNVEELEIAGEPGRGWQASWPPPLRQLETLLAEVAGARRVATVAYAEAYLAAEGTQQARAATAELAAAGPREELERLEGLAEAFRMVLAAEARTEARRAAAAGPAWPRPPEPGPNDPPSRGAV